MRLAAALLIVALAGCQDRRSFDDRYSDTAGEIERRAGRIDADLNRVDGNDAVPSGEGPRASGK